MWRTLSWISCSSRRRLSFDFPPLVTPTLLSNDSPLLSIPRYQPLQSYTTGGRFYEDEVEEEEEEKAREDTKRVLSRAERDRVAMRFREADINGDGLVDVTEIKVISARLGWAPSPARWKQALQHVEEEGGTLSLPHFEKWWSQYAPPSSKP